MTAPVLAHKKFYIIKPAAGTNQIKNPRFGPPDFVEDWLPYGTGVTIEETGDEQRFASYSMQVNTATGVKSYAIYINVTVTNGDDYTFSCYVKGTAGQAMSLNITNSASAIKGSTSFTTTGYWQRQEVTITAAEDASNYRLEVARNAVASTDPFYVDGVQFEQASAATTLIEGYMPGCRWEGYARNSSSIRSAQYRKGGEIVDLSDYCEIVQVTGLGHGDWNQILTKMTSGGDMYQTHTRKSRNFSIVVDFTGNSLSEIEANRKAVIDLIRPDLLTGQEMIVRYQGVDVNGDEATNPVDIVCVPLPATLTDTPDLPSYQRAVLNFTIPSGLLNGAYNDGAELDWIADFPAERIVKRDPQGNWCEWGGAAYESLITGLYGPVLCMAEGPDGKIYVGGMFTNAGGVAGADYLARWNPVTEQWEAVGAPAFTDPGSGIAVRALAFDAAGNLYAGGYFLNAQSVAEADYIAKFDGTNWTALGTGTNGTVYAIEIAPDGNIYAGGNFTSAGGVANTGGIAKWDGAVWSPLSTGLNGTVYALAFAPNGDLYIGGAFTDPAYPYLCKWGGSAFSVIGTNTDIGGQVYSLAFGETGWLYIGGRFTSVGDNPNADYIAKWSGNTWESLDTGTNDYVYKIFAISNKIYASGSFTSAGSLHYADRVAVYSNGTWQSLDIDLPGNAVVYSVLSASDGSLYIGGYFSTTLASENAECGIISDRVYEIGVASASANTYPFMQVRGPGTLKAITNYSTGKSIMFDGLTLQAGEHINLYFDPLDLKFESVWSGRGNLMRYVVPGSDYGDFYLRPGSNTLSMFMTGSDSNSGAFMSWTPLFWGIDGALL
ncbi:MAG: carbohydrate binding domain-containing protein [Synergistaceae bacterium]|jgi:hypothetical protein